MYINGGLMKGLLIIILMLTCGMAIGATISGYVTDAGNGERLRYANIIVLETKIGVMTSREGVFSIGELQPGEYTLEITHLGYGLFRKQLRIRDELDNQYLMVELNREAIKLEGSQVSGSQIQKGNVSTFRGKKIRLSHDQLRGELIKNLPQAADADVIRSLQVLPGIQSVNETSNGLYVRGGTPDQNLILLDDTEVYNPSHLGGIFSTFNSDAISSVEVYKAGFPSRYGDRLSSVLDIKNKDGNRKRMEGVARLSLMSGSATLEGPWSAGDHKGSWMGSFRRTIYEIMDYDMPESYFYDGHFKFNWDAGLKEKFFISSYFGEDYLHMEEGEDMKMNWGNNTLTGQWLHIFSSQLYGKLNIARSNFHFDLDQVFDGDSSLQQKNTIEDITVKTDFHYKPVDKHELEIGAEIKHLDITFGAETNLDINTSHYPWLEVPSWQNSAYIQDEWEIIDKLTLQPGLRLTACETKSEYHPSKKVENYWRLSPRISARWDIKENLALAISCGRYHQYLTSANRTDWPMSLWLPIDSSVEPGEADHFVIGIQTHSDYHLDLALEGYYKTLRNQVALSEEAFMEWEEGDFLSEAYQIGNGYAFGGEILIKNNWQGIEGFASYTYSHCRLKVNGINIDPANGKEQYYFPQHDRTHCFSITENYYLSEQTGLQAGSGDITIGLVYFYNTGQPTQAPEGIYEDIYGWQFVEGYLDNARLPAYSRLDLSLKFKWQFSDYSIEPYLMVVNALDHSNVFTRDWYPLVENNQANIAYRDTYMFSRMPFIGINLKW